MMLKKAFLTNSSGILLSRIFGFFRDVCMASILGAGIYSDIFFVAFKLPNLFRRIFGEGAFTQSFIPSFVNARRKGAFSVSILIIFTTALIFISILVWAFSLLFTKLLAFGFTKESIDLASPIVAINFWYLDLIFIVTLLGALLQYKNSFWASAYNTALLNISMISALLLCKDKESIEIVYMLSYGVLAGGIAQIIVHLYPLYKFGFFKLFFCGFKDLKLMLTTTTKKTKMLKEDLKSFFRQFFPALLGSSTAQIASFIDTFIASFLISGSISYLYYANRIFQLPLAIFAIAISTALFPTIARAIKNNNHLLALQNMKRAFWFLTIMLCMCVVGGIVLREEIIWLLYQRGEFGVADTIITSKVFAMYLLGLLPFGLSRIISLWLYSHHMQGKAAKISAISLLSGVVFSLILIKPLGSVGLALSSSIAGFILLALNIKIFGKKNFFYILKNKKALALLAILLLVEGMALWGFKILIADLDLL